MNSNDLLAQIAGITETDQGISHNDLVCEEVNYEDMEEPIYDSVEEAEEEVQHTRNTRLYKRELRGLTFVNPGGEMSKMLPDSADIVSTSRSRRAHQQQAVEPKEPKDAVLHHDKLGRLTSIVKGSATVHDPCDCLREKCNGCNWPCRTCKSRKCLVGCRQNRKEMVVKIEDMYTVEGSVQHQTLTNPYFPFAVKD